MGNYLEYQILLAFEGKCDGFLCICFREWKNALACLLWHSNSISTVLSCVLDLRLSWHCKHFEQASTAGDSKLRLYFFTKIFLKYYISLYWWGTYELVCHLFLSELCKVLLCFNGIYAIGLLYWNIFSLFTINKQKRKKCLRTLEFWSRPNCNLNKLI